MDKKPSILVVDDERPIAELVGKLLVEEGMDVHVCFSGTEALSTFGRERADLVILDIMMPELDGFEVCKGIRAVSDVPIIFLSAKDEEVDKVVGLTLGADDYVSKPFKPRELVARVKARLRRSTRFPEESSSLLSARGIEVDVDAHTASLLGEPLSLSPKEFGTLVLLMRNCGKPVSAQEIFETVWGGRFDDAAGNSVMVHIRNLRKKLAAIDGSQKFIETAWGVGYKISVPGGSR